LNKNECLRSVTLWYKAYMRNIRAEHLGMCFGVKDAIALALETARREPLTILGDLVHNETVSEDLRANGINIRQPAESVDTRTVMIIKTDFRK
jgi:4-hydroxy-3-methylbut-2-enyl diphosphate reductase